MIGGGVLSSGKGADLTSASTVTPTNVLHSVTGTAAIATITKPSGALSGEVLVLIPKGVFTWTTGGNIGLAGTAVVNRALWLIWDDALSKWYPSYIA